MQHFSGIHTARLSLSVRRARALPYLEADEMVAPEAESDATDLREACHCLTMYVPVAGPNAQIRYAQSARLRHRSDWPPRPVARPGASQDVAVPNTSLVSDAPPALLRRNYVGWAVRPTQFSRRSCPPPRVQGDLLHCQAAAGQGEGSPDRSARRRSAGPGESIHHPPRSKRKQLRHRA